MSRLIAFLNWLIAKLPDASPLQRGLVNRVAQTFGGVKSQIDPTLQGTPARRLLHPEVSVLDFGADPTGIADSSPAFRDAINSFWQRRNEGGHGARATGPLPHQLT